MKYFFILVIITLIPRISSAQNIELINSGELIKKSVTLYDSGKYKSALSELNKICRSDTNYVWAVYEKAINCEADSQYTQAIKYCEEGLALKEQREYEPDIYNTYGNVLDDIGQPEKAIKVFDSAIAKYPSYSLLYFNKGIALLALKRPNDAEVLFQKTLMVNPYMYSAHFQLGIAALRQGKIIPSFLSFTGYLLVNPSGKYSSNAIGLLSQISKGTNEILGYKDKRTVAPDENYQAVEEIVLSKIALDKAYKPIIALDDQISRQIQAVFEKLDYSETNADFWIQYYLPYFKQVYNDGKFELFINHIFSNVKIPIIQDYNRKNKKELEVFVNGAATYFDLIRTTRELYYNKRDLATERYYFENGKLVGKGALVNKGKTLNGHWEFYYPGGNLKCVGDYNPEGGREGERTYYFNNGAIKAKEHSKNGKLEGLQTYYFENGNVSSVENYVNDKAQGLVTTYTYAGNIKSTTNYKAGKKDGEQRNFYSNGSLQSVHIYLDGVLTGIAQEYYKNGQIKVVTLYSSGKAEGAYKSYYESGKLSTEGQYLKDHATSEWKYYFENGKVKEKRNYVNDVEEGLHEEYFDNGQLSVTYIAKKGETNGEALYYDKDGKIFSKYTYDSGSIRSSKYFDKSGRIISSSETNDIISYTPDGFKKAHFMSDKKGNLDGPDTIFYPSGKISQVNIYSKGELNGPSVSYYLNGNKKSEINMTDGKDNGLYTSYYVNAKLESEGWIVDDQYQGEWEYRDELGRLTTKSYYLNGDLNGYREDYFPNGEKATEQKFYTGWLEKLTQYDHAGKVIAVDSFPKGTGKYTLVSPTGQVITRTNYLNGDFDGLYKTYYFDGSLESSSFYKKGIIDGAYFSYHYGGIKNKEGNYKDGNKIGMWKSYDEDGKLSNTTEYVNDMMNGERIYYFPDGGKDYVAEYKDDEINGLVKKYDPDGTLAYQVTFENDNAKEYSYLGKDGKLMPAIPITAINGSLNAYFPNGKLSRETHYSYGIKNGADKVYYSNGQIRDSDTSVYGLGEGLHTEYYPDGKIQSLYHYVDDNATGICQEFDKKGILKKEIVFENGITHGPVKYYNENGKLAKTMVYFYGKLISVKNE